MANGIRLGSGLPKKTADDALERNTMSRYLDRFAPNRSIPFLDRGYFRTRLGLGLGLLAANYSWFRELLEVATNRQGS